MYRSILEAMYYGSVRPNSRTYSEDSLFAELEQLKKRNYDDLTATLNDSEKETFEKYCDAQEELESITRFDLFTYALKFGILLMSKIFVGRREVCGDD